MDHLGHDGGNLGLHPEVHQDPLVLAPLLGAPRAPALRVQPRVLDRALRVLGARDDAAGGELPVADGVVHEAEGAGPTRLLLPRHQPRHRGQHQHQHHLAEQIFTVRLCWKIMC